MPADLIEDDAMIIPKLVKRVDSVLDIGANLGVFSRFLAKLVGPEGRTDSFEPIPQTLTFLRHNMGKLNLSQVQPIPFALSDANRVDKMVIPTYRWGSECWYDARIKMANARPGWREIQVESRTLDSFPSKAFRLLSAMPIITSWPCCEGDLKPFVDAIPRCSSK